MLISATFTSHTYTHKRFSVLLFTFLFLFFWVFTKWFLFFLQQLALTFHTRQVNLVLFPVESPTLYLFLRFVVFRMLPVYTCSTRQRDRYYFRLILHNCCFFCCFMYSANCQECQMFLCSGNHFVSASNQRRKSGFACFRNGAHLILVFDTPLISRHFLPSKRFVARTSCSCFLLCYFTDCCCFFPSILLFLMVFFAFSTTFKLLEFIALKSMLQQNVFQLLFNLWTIRVYR